MNKLTLKAQRGVDWFLAVVLCSCDVANGMMHREYPWFLLSPEWWKRMPCQRAELEMLKVLSHVLAHYWLYCRNITALRRAKQLGDASAKIQPWAPWLVSPLCCIWHSLLRRPAKLTENFSPEGFLYICFLQQSRGKACFIFLHVWQLEKNRRVETEIKDFKVKK